MPWKANSVMEARARMVLEYERGEVTMTELCQAYEVTRETGYYWLRRYRSGGLESLGDLGREPKRHPNQTAAELEQRVLELRRAHMRWGPRKLKRVLERDCPEQRWPAASTMGTMLRREGLAIPRRKRRRTQPYTQPFAAADAPNRVWCADFKGWFRTRDGERIDPFTLSDAHSRYLLRCQAVDKADHERVRAICEAAFREYGLPQAIRSDNGAPFASCAIAGLSRLAVWWMKLGIVPERIAPGHPEQNGRHERMHRTLKQETASPAAAHRRAQQQRFDHFREEYNQLRPHEALAMQTPATYYQPSPRQYPARLPEVEYGTALQVRRVQEHGEFNWKHQHVFLSEVLWGERIGLLPNGDCGHTIFFGRFPIARFDSRRLKVLPLPAQYRFYGDEAGEEELPPSPAPHPLNQNLSGMCPV
jgi:transposase InsO family protein